jgi:hypothetical protein
MPYVAPGASMMSFGSPYGSSMGFKQYEGAMSAGAVCGVVFGAGAVVALILIIVFAMKSNKPACPPAQLTGQTVTGGRSSHRLAAEHAAVPSQYGSGQMDAQKSASATTLQKLREEHAKVGTCEDPQTHLKYSGGFKNNDFGANRDFLIQMLEGEKHPMNQTIKKTQQNGGPPEAPAMPMPLGLYTQAGIGHPMGQCK